MRFWHFSIAERFPVVLDDLSTGSRNAIPSSVPFIVGDVGDSSLVFHIIETHKVEAILHFAAKIVVPELITDPLSYYLNNTVKTRALLEAAVKGEVRHFVFSSTAAIYGNPSEAFVTEETIPAPLSPYGMSKLMSELMIRDVSAAYHQRYVILRYFNVAGADPARRHGQSTANATHLIKVAMETALSQRAFMNIFGDDYPTPDGTCVRDFVHVSDLARAHLLALDQLRLDGSLEHLTADMAEVTRYGKLLRLSKTSRVLTSKFVKRPDVRVIRPQSSPAMLSYSVWVGSQNWMIFR